MLVTRVLVVLVVAAPLCLCLPLCLHLCLCLLWASLTGPRAENKLTWAIPRRKLREAGCVKVDPSELRVREICAGALP